MLSINWGYICFLGENLIFSPSGDISSDLRRKGSLCTYFIDLVQGYRVFPSLVATMFESRVIKRGRGF